MGRRLTDYERRQRAREALELQRKKAAMRERERARRRRERESEREQIRRERADARAERRREREREEERREAGRARRRARDERRVDAWQAYMDGLATVHHRDFSLADAKAAFATRLAPWTMPGQPFEPVPFPERFSPRPFHFDAYLPTPWRPDEWEGSPEQSRFRGLSMLFHGVGLLGIVVAVAGWRLTGALTLTAVGGVSGALLVADVIAVALARRAQQGRFEARHAEEGRAHQTAVLEGSNRHAAAEAAARAAHEASEAERRRVHAARQAAWDAEEQDRRERHTDQEWHLSHLFAERDAERIDTLTQAASGTPWAMRVVLRESLPVEPDLDPPDGLRAADPDDLDVTAWVLDARRVGLRIEVPGEAVVPQQVWSLTPARKQLSVQDMPVRQGRQTFDAHVASLALATAVRTVEVLPHLSEVHVEVSWPSVDPATGQPEDLVVLQAVYPTALLDQVDLRRLDPVALLDRVEHRRRKAGSRARGRIRSWTEDVTSFMCCGGRWLAHGVYPGARPRRPFDNAYTRRDPDMYPGVPDPDRSDRVVVGAPGGPTTLAAALERARPGDTIVLPPGTYAGGQTVHRPVAIEGESGDPADVLVESFDPVWSWSATDGALRGLTLARAGGSFREGEGALVVTDARLDVVRCRLSAQSSLGLDVQGPLSQVELQDCGIDAIDDASDDGPLRVGARVGRAASLVLRDCRTEDWDVGADVVSTGALSVHGGQFLRCAVGVRAVGDSTTTVEGVRFQGEGVAVEVDGGAVASVVDCEADGEAPWRAPDDPELGSIEHSKTG